MTERPVRRKGESISAHYLRIVEWEKIHKAECMARARDIDSALSKAPRIATEIAVSRQRELERKSLHEHALTSPALMRVLRRMQAHGVNI